MTDETKRIEQLEKGFNLLYAEIEVLKKKIDLLREYVNYNE